jgi:hypothetical protein
MRLLLALALLLAACGGESPRDAWEATPRSDAGPVYADAAPRYEGCVRYCDDAPTCVLDRARLCTGYEITRRQCWAEDTISTLPLAAPPCVGP